jgi:hypothetical protein
MSENVSEVTARVLAWVGMVRVMTRQSSIEAMSRKQAAALLGLSPGTLARWAVQRKGPRYARSGETRGKVWYSAADLAAWLDEHKTTPRAVRGGVTTTKTGG